MWSEWRQEKWRAEARRGRRENKRYRELRIVERGRVDGCRPMASMYWCMEGRWGMEAWRHGMGERREVGKV